MLRPPGLKRRRTPGEQNNVPQSLFRRSLNSSKSNSRIYRKFQKTTQILDLRQKEALSNRPLFSPPQSPPAARLRRLGVRQADDNHSTDSSVPCQKSDTANYSQHHNLTNGSEALNLLKSEAEDRYGVSPAGRQLQRFLHSDDNQTQLTQSVNGAKTSITSLNPLGRTKVLKCPVCAKEFLSFYGHDLHLDQHESTAIKCWPCNQRFSSNKSLLQHQRLRHNKRKQTEDVKGRGFHNLIFVDFSCDKFPAISQRYCEKNCLQAACNIHNYACKQCTKSFPSQAALDLHVSQYHYHPSKYICTLCNHDYLTKAQLEKHKQAYIDSMTKKLHLSDNKRRYLRALSLMPLCAASTHNTALRDRQPPAVNMHYYNKLCQVDRVTKLFYPVSSEVSQVQDNESDSSHS